MFRNFTPLVPGPVHVRACRSASYRRSVPARRAQTLHSPAESNGGGPGGCGPGDDSVAFREDDDGNDSPVETQAAGRLGKGIITHGPHWLDKLAHWLEHTARTPLVLGMLGIALGALGLRWGVRATVRSAIKFAGQLISGGEHHININPQRYLWLTAGPWMWHMHTVTAWILFHTGRDELQLGGWVGGLMVAGYAVGVYCVYNDIPLAPRQWLKPRFYSEGLGLPVTVLTERWAELQAGSSTLALKAVEGEAYCTPGYSPFLTFTVEDLQGTVTRLLGMGAVLDGPIQYPSRGKMWHKWLVQAVIVRE
ncbi:hypothetical protein WJX72_007778 [[Myrmecia] bisecta]|uniref:Uncharacterized protein n=1 Tax=[Myrmecia] bisecta TaxID=41462 RepID=A0AAW1R886_9CHLO